MNATDIPQRFQIPFAHGAGGSYIRPIPLASQIGIQDGAASLTDGFPPDNFIPISGGGVPPFGQDINGLQNQITAWCRWQAAGGPIVYDATFSTAIGGYPAGAVLRSTVTPAISWVSAVDANTTDPDSILAANWIATIRQRATSAQVKAGTDDTVVITPKSLRDATVFSRGVNGYRIEPDGYIEQWGYSATFPIATEGSFTIPFLFPFPAVTINFFAIVINASAINSGDTTIQEISLSLSAANVYANSHQSALSDASGYRWKATGY